MCNGVYDFTWLLGDVGALLPFTSISVLPLATALTSIQHLTRRGVATPEVQWGWAAPRLVLLSWFLLSFLLLSALGLDIPRFTNRF